MESVARWILMVAMCCLASVEIESYIEEKKKAGNYTVLAWFNLAVALICIITALKITFI